MDDWIFLPPMKFDADGKYYTLFFDWKDRVAYFDQEFMEVALCKSIDGETVVTSSVIMQRTQAPGYWTTMELDFAAPAAGDYYIGFHAISSPDQYGQYICNIKVEDLGISTSSPALAQEITAKALDGGELKADITFTMPTKTIGGADIPAATELTAVVEATGTATVTGKPGETVTATVETVQGENTVSIYVKEGDKRGQKAKTYVYTGVSTPDNVSNLQLTTNEDRSVVTMSWDAPTSGVDGGYINPDDLVYIIFEYKEGMFGYGWEQVAVVDGATSWEFTPEKQDLFNLGVMAENEAGRSPMLMNGNIVAGKLYDLPLAEPLTETHFDANPWLVYYIEGVAQPQWGFSPLSAINADKWNGNDKAAFAAISGQAGAALELTSPYMSAVNKKDIEVEMRVYAGEGAAQLTVKAETPEYEKPLAVYTLDNPATDADGFATVRFTLPWFCSFQSYLRLWFCPVIANPGDLFAMTEVTIDGATSGITAANSANGDIIGGKGIITVSGAVNQTIAVYTLDGLLVTSRIAGADNCVVSVVPGIYIVKAGDRVAKVAVK